jgi:cytidine deaminase
MSVAPALSLEDSKLVTLARSARARAGTAQGAAVRDADERTYVAVDVGLASLQLTALQLAVAMAVSSGAGSLEAAVVVGDEPDAGPGLRALHDVTPDAIAYHAGPDGTLR